MKTPKISYNDVLGNELSVVCRLLTSSIITDVPKRNGYNTNENNNHLLTDDEKYICHLFNLISNIDNCLSTIENSSIFVKRFYGKKYYNTQKINIIDYSLYHYDIFCYKISTLRDLYLKIINHLYKLNFKEKECTWKNIEKKQSEINNPFLFSLLENNFKHLDIIDKRRNKSAHEGVIKHKSFEYIDPYVTFTMYADIIPSHISKDITITHNYWLDSKLKESRKAFLEEIEVCRYNAFVFTRCILCSLSDKFIRSINNDTKIRYSETIEKALQIILSRRICINSAHSNECPNSPNYKSTD